MFLETIYRCALLPAPPLPLPSPDRFLRHETKRKPNLYGLVSVRGLLFDKASLYFHGFSTITFARQRRAKVWQNRRFGVRWEYVLNRIRLIPANEFAFRSSPVSPLPVCDMIGKRTLRDCPIDTSPTIPLFVPFLFLFRSRINRRTCKL